MCTLLCVCPPRVESLFLPVLSKSCNQIPLAFKVWFSRNSSYLCQTPGWEAWCGAQNLHSSGWTSVVSVLQFVSHPPSSYGIWFYCDCAPPTISLCLLLCLWMWSIFFGEFQSLPVNDCSAVSCDSSVLARGSESTSFYSAILNQSLEMLLIFRMLILYPATLLNLLIRSNSFWWSLWGFLYVELFHLQIETILLLPFQFWYILLIFLSGCSG